MNAVLASGLSILAASTSLLAAPVLAADEGACAPRVVQSETKFPLVSQLRGQKGTVYINVRVDENGRAQSAEMTRSSGHRLLDRAATNSVIGDWVFDVSSCTRSDLPTNHLVAVEYRNDEY
jgi:outer membrane biosynthesis protein TonB